MQSLRPRRKKLEQKILAEKKFFRNLKILEKMQFLLEQKDEKKSHKIQEIRPNSRSILPPVCLFDHMGTRWSHFSFHFEPSYRGDGFRLIFSARFWNSENVENIWKSLNVTHFESLSRDCSVEQRLKRTCLKSWKSHEITRFGASTFRHMKQQKGRGGGFGRIFLIVSFL